jgi:hypothetical protein
MVSKFLQIVLLASVKYFLTIPYALLIGMNYNLAVLAIITGGVAGFIFFYYLFKPVSMFFSRAKPMVCRFIPEAIRMRYADFCKSWLHPRRKELFSKRSRRIVTIKRKFGMWGIIVTTPVILSIPVGAYLARHFYKGDRHIVLYMLLSIISWGIVFSSILRIFPGIAQ